MARLNAADKGRQQFGEDAHDGVVFTHGAFKFIALQDHRRG